MPDPFFYTQFLVALRDLTNHAHSHAYQILREELTTDAISEAQFSIPLAFKTQAKFVCDALRWTRMKGRIVHVSSIHSALSPHGLYLTGTAEVLSDGVRETFEHVPVSLLRSPALLAHTQLQMEHIQNVIQEWDSVFRAIPQKEVHSFLNRVLQPPDGDILKTKHKTFMDNVGDPVRDVLPAHLKKPWADCNKQGIKENFSQLIEFPKFMPPKLSGDLSAVDHHHLCEFLLAWIADAIALPHFKCAIGQKGLISLATHEIVRDIVMSSVVRLRTTEDLFQFDGDRLPSWVTAPTYAIMVPDAAEQMPDPTREPKNFSDHIDFASLAVSQNPPFSSGSILLNGVP